MENKQERLGPLLGRPEAAAYLGITVSTLAVWACTKRYDLPYVKVGRHVKYRVQDLDAFILARTVGRELRGEENRSLHR